jgi:dienelactone hydrolase
MRVVTATAVIFSLVLASDLSAGENVRPVQCAIVTLKTSDNVTLAADHCNSGKPGSPAVVLLHMIPPHHDRTNYPESFRRKLADKGLEVLSIDRRGAGDSQGVAKEAYTGPNGVLDVQAALSWLAANTDADLSSWGCVGASNGTTSCLDYTAHAGKAEAITGPSALVFMTGGKYTETQTALAGSAATSVPVLFTFNGKEEEWSVGQKAVEHSGDWRFQAYEPGGHGTRVFAPNPEAMNDVANFLAASLREGK